MESEIMCRYMARKYKERREELELTKEEVAMLIGKPVATVTKSENSFAIGLKEMMDIGEAVYGLNVRKLLDEAEAYAKEEVKKWEEGRN